MASIFRTLFDQYADRNGSAVEILHIITEPDATHDQEVLPMVRVRFPDGFIGEAFPDELTPDPTI